MIFKKLYQIQDVIEAKISLQMILKDWHMIKKTLAELPRKRTTQVEAFQKRMIGIYSILIVSFPAFLGFNKVEIHFCSLNT